MIQTATYEIVTHLGSGGMGDRNVYPMHGELALWMANYQIALNSGVSMSDTIPPCATSSSFSFM